MIIGISGFVFLQKWPFCDAKLFPKNGLLKPLVLQCFLGARFFGQVVKRETLDTFQKND